jgi:hypothetical protein
VPPLEPVGAPNERDHLAACIRKNEI